MPAAITTVVVTDRTETIRASVADVQGTLALSIVLVVLVIYLFLRSWRATLIPAIALPLSLIGTFGVMALCGYGLDNLSLMALVGRHRLRGGRRHRHDRERRPLSRTGRAAARRRLQRGGADRLHHRLAHGVADRRVHPAAVHDRRGRPPVQRVRHHPVGFRGGVGPGVADADADDVRPAAAPGERTKTLAGGAAGRCRVPRPAGGLCAHAALVAAPPDAHAGGRRLHPRRHDFSLRHHPQRLPAAAGHRRDRRGHRSRPEHLRRPHDHACRRRRPPSCAPTRRCMRSPVSSAPATSTPPPTPAA